MLILSLDALDEMEYEKVKVRGTFDHSAELYIRPRAPVEDDSAKGMRQQPQTGAFVVTAFQLADTKSVPVQVSDICMQS